MQVVHPGYHKSKEKKYANKEKIEISGKRPVGLNGISNPVTAPDLLLEFSLQIY